MFERRQRVAPARTIGHGCCGMRVRHEPGSSGCASSTLLSLWGIMQDRGLDGDTSV